MNEAYTTFTGVTRLKQGITPQGVFIPENDEKPSESGVQLTRSVTVPTPSTSSELDPRFWGLTIRDSQRGSDQPCPSQEVQDHHQCTNQP